GGMSIVAGCNVAPVLNRTLNNVTGTATLTYTGCGNAWTIGSGAVFNNQAGATFDFKGDQNISGSGTFNNGGSLTRTTNTGAVSMSPTLNNTGTVSVQSGGLI